jgi:hypothetical protein
VTIQIELKFQFDFEFCIRRKEIINYSRAHVSLYRLLLFFYYMIRLNVTRLETVKFPQSSVAIRELCKPTYKIIGLYAAVINFILGKWKCFLHFLKP